MTTIETIRALWPEQLFSDWVRLSDGSYKVTLKVQNAETPKNYLALIHFTISGDTLDIQDFDADSVGGREAASLIPLRGTTAGRPGASSEGQLYIETDLLLRMWRDSGAGWDLVSAPTSTVLSTKTSDYTITATDGVIVADATTGNILITLPAAAGLQGKVYTVKRIDSSANTVTVQGAQTIDDAVNQLLNQYDALMIVSDNTEWWII